MDAVTARRQKKMSQQQEQKVAEDLGGRTVAGSGAGRTSGGGDVRKRSEIRVECKFTEKNFYVLQLSDLVKIRNQAIMGGVELPVLQIRFMPPRAQAVEFAVEPGSGEDTVLTTDRKRMKLVLSDLQRYLLQGPVLSVWIANSCWDISYWTTYLKERERADDQHNP